MKVKTFCESSAQKVEEKIKYFLSENNIEIVSTNQSINDRIVLFTIIYKEKQII
jgi:hypothetical protein